jgi:hypothetical protein
VLLVGRDREEKAVTVVHARAELRVPHQLPELLRAALGIDPDLEGPHSLSTVDLDGDGDIDAATCGRLNDGIAVWYENDGKGSFRRHLVGKDQGSYDLRTVDLDGDGDLDILIAGHNSANIVWYESPLK